MSTRTTWHFISRQRSRKMVPVISAGASFRWIAKSLSDSLNQPKSHEVLHAPYLPTGSQVSGSAIPCSQPFPLFLTVQGPPGRVCYRCAPKPPSFVISTLWHTLLCSFERWQWFGWVGRGHSSSPKLKASYLKHIALCFLGDLHDIARLRQMKWEGRQYIRARHAFCDRV